MANLSIQAPERTNKTATSYIILATLIIATGLAYVSWLGICTEACAKSHSYRLYGLTFEMIGMAYFPFVAILYYFSNRSPLLLLATALLISMGLGAELFFMYVQKFLIGTWCPLCLSIAAALGFAALFFLPAFILYDKTSFKGFYMNKLFRSSAVALGMLAGFIVSFAGLGQYSELQAEEDHVKSQIAFGNTRSPIEVYIFTDWICPACESLEETFDKVASQLGNRVKFIFVDDPVHETTVNYTPYNLAFMVHNKSQYFPLRKAMHTLANDKKEPTDQDMINMAAPYGVRLQELPYGAVSAGTKYFDELIKKFNIEGTPTIVVYNSSTKKSKKLEGRTQISQEKIVQAVDALSK